MDSVVPGWLYNYGQLIAALTSFRLHLKKLHFHILQQSKMSYMVYVTSNGVLMYFIRELEEVEWYDRGSNCQFPVFRDGCQAF